MTSSGSGHKVASVILRFLELACGAIVLGLLGHFCDLVNEASNISVDGRIIYAMVVAGITIVYSIVFFAPFDILFMAFPFDFILFIMWLVAFCLLETVRTPCCSIVDDSSIFLGYDRERGATSAVQSGTTTIGAIIGDVSGGLGRWAGSASMEPDVRNGGLFSPFRSST
ncbi:hypothetical protein FOXG_07233 [Fusarium oxysporum f. sp. lycopersici 4287]|uniref:MARVEL domain-containing protein n=1 Tax=Fusarium oxysporum f. sp. lycopersici (strain 4287 / CBS 123668 / FGSC 9935 / NRRL 34936) TaxID=426428 RepID=A0A0J9V5U1_FUSO4|nr:hypothetical protein FOXG_07233 [Fusarium oxysporum f. sp. lycopersici 4287]KNB06543.1 hypothetical protein FOXG_07233 [Fusarium oxysporum f. sp. lycopersici 4287]